MWVVKLGGSLARSARLPAWLEVLARNRADRVIVVPGGGPFADQVRTAQSRWGFGDSAAHCMAVLAMEQYGIMLLAMRPELRAAVTPSQLLRDNGRGGACVWMPTRMVLAVQDLPASWAVTSDSLAAWLARKLHADHLLLVKSVQPEGTAARCGELQALGVVDGAFGEFIDAGFTGWICGPDDPARLGLALRGATDPGVRIVPDGAPPTPPSPSLDDRFARHSRLHLRGGMRLPFIARDKR